MKLNFKLNYMREITMLELRRDARRWLEAIKNGERFVLTYRGQPVARLEPVRSEVLRGPAEDPLLRIDDYAVDGPG